MRIASIPRISPWGDQEDWKTAGKGIIRSLFGFPEPTCRRETQSRKTACTLYSASPKGAPTGTLTPVVFWAPQSYLDSLLRVCARVCTCVLCKFIPHAGLCIHHHPTVFERHSNSGIRADGASPDPCGPSACCVSGAMWPTPVLPPGDPSRTWTAMPPCTAPLPTPGHSNLHEAGKQDLTTSMKGEESER